MAITDLGHTAFACYDIEKSLAFYAQLGIHESFRLLRDDGSLALVYLHISGDRFLELFPGGPSPDADRAASFKHICLMTDDIHTLVDELKAQGVTIDKDIAEGRDTNLQAWASDPDGNAIEFMQIADTSPQRATADGKAIQETDILKVGGR